MRLSAFLEASPGFQGHKIHCLTTQLFMCGTFPGALGLPSPDRYHPSEKCHLPSSAFLAMFTEVITNYYGIFFFFTQAVFANYSQPSTSHISMPAGSDARKTSSATSSIQKAPSLHKVMSSQSTAPQLVPKPPANHRQTVIRKAPAQRISK